MESLPHFDSTRLFNGLALAAGLLLASALGCGPSQPQDPTRAVVSGVVTFNGKPLPAGTISFESLDPPKATSASITEGGKYATERVPIGNCQVSINTASIQYGNPAAYVAIPAKYADTATSELSVEIKAGENENVNFDLQP